MRVCPCCLEAPTPGAPGGRQLGGTCDVCGEAVCARCLGAGTRPGSEGRVCRTCLWDIMAARGYRPSFPEPPGRRLRAERAARPPCVHGRVRGWMGFCPDCGEEVPWEAADGNPTCAECGAPSHESFNACWACGESFEEDNPVLPAAEGFALDFDCSAGCGGPVAWLMPHCPWCAGVQAWHFAGEGRDPECTGCGAPVDAAWVHCAFCGTEAGVEVEASAAADAAAPEDDEGDAPSESAASEPERDAEPEPGAREAPASPAPVEPSPWDVLGVTPGTPLPEVRRAYLGLVAQYHPDKVAQLGPKLQAVAQEETRRLNAAWEQLREAAG
ncbi:MAG: J domain-containing protein [Myxococcaceae bacterium]|nr:J domain-containing protein [Myxococcaceae bacterium]MCI0673794.1 J domain-containing protein [Myxococcaceae bacterium]